MNMRSVGWLRKGAFWLALLILTAGAAPLAAEFHPGLTPRVSVWPVNQELLVGRNGSAELRIENVVGLYAVELHIAYNTNLLDIHDANGSLPGIQIGDNTIFAGRRWHTDINVVDKATGTIEVVFALDSIEPVGVDGSGLLGRLDFVTLQPGVSPIRYVEVILAQRGGESIPHEVADGQVRIVLIPSTSTFTPTSGPSLTPTRTLTPTPTATSLAGADGSAQVYIDPAWQQVPPGADGYADIMVADAPGLFGAWVRLAYNPGVLTIIDSGAEPGVQIEPGSLWDERDWYALDNLVSGGIITYGAKLSFNQEPLPSGGRLARIPFHAVNVGSCPFQFIEVILTNQDGTSIEATSADGVVNVALHLPTLTPTWTPGGPTATRTATPTITPTTGPSPTPTRTATLGPSPTPTWTPTAGPSPTASPTRTATRTVTPTASPTPTTSPTPLLALNPSASSLGLGGMANVDVQVSNAVNLYSVEFYIDYNPAIVEILDEDAVAPGVQIALGPFLSPDSVVQNIVNPTAGRIHAAYSQASPSPAQSGGGVVASFRARALAQGATALALHTTQLTDVFASSMAHDAVGGLVSVNTQVVTGRVRLQGRYQHNGVAIINGGSVLATTFADGSFVAPCPVGVGQSLTLRGEFAKYLSAARTFTVTADTIINLGEVTLLGGDVVGPQIVASRTAGCPGTITVTIPGPPDSAINIIDLTFVGGNFGALSTDEDWQPSADGCHPEYMRGQADINGDGRCNIFDLVQVGNHFGSSGVQLW